MTEQLIPQRHRDISRQIPIAVDEVTTEWREAPAGMSNAEIQTAIARHRRGVHKFRGTDDYGRVV